MPKEALFAGYRPCLRCRPLEGDEAPPWVARLLQRVERRPDTRIRERDLRTMGVEPARVRRYFATRYGLTFQVYSSRPPARTGIRAHSPRRLSGRCGVRDRIRVA